MTEALRHPLAARQSEKVMMREARRLGAEGFENFDLCRSIGEMVLAADDVSDTHLDVVDDRGERIEPSAIGAAGDRIGERGGIGLDAPAHEIVPGDLFPLEFEAEIGLPAF